MPDSKVHDRHIGWVSADVGVELMSSAQSKTIHKTALFIRQTDFKSDFIHQAVFWLPKTSCRAKFNPAFMNQEDFIWLLHSLFRTNLSADTTVGSAS
jgi:hypothetical protein